MKAFAIKVGSDSMIESDEIESIWTDLEEAKKVLFTHVKEKGLTLYSKDPLANPLFSGFNNPYFYWNRETCVYIQEISLNTPSIYP